MGFGVVRLVDRTLGRTNLPGDADPTGFSYGTGAVSMQPAGREGWTNSVLRPTTRRWSGARSANGWCLCRGRQRR